MYRLAYKKPVVQSECHTPETTLENQKTARPYVPFSNIVTKENGWDIAVSLPGYTKEEVNISLTMNKLSISGKKEKTQEMFSRREWNNEWFERAFTLGENTDAENISAEMNNGILTIHVPKKARAVTNIDIQ